MIIGIPAGQVIDELKLALDYSTDDEVQKIMTSLNLALYDICGKFSQYLLRRSMTISAGDYLPANIAGIDAIYDADYKYAPRDRAQRDIVGDNRRKYYISQICTTPLVHRRGIGITKGSTSFTVTGDALASTVVGEYIRLASQMGFFRLATTGTIATTYMGPTLINEWFEIRPAGTPMLGLCDEEGDDLDADVTLDYWVLPQPIYDASQLIPLPTTEYLFLKTLMRLLRFKENEGKAQNYVRDLQAAKEDLIAQTPRYLCPEFPQDSSGDVQTWGVESYE